MRKHAFILAILLLPVCTLAQEIIKPPEAKLLTRFRFKQYNGGVMIVKARFENLPDTLNFVLDTGSGGISLDSTTCATLNIPIQQSDTSIIGIGGKRKVEFAHNKTLHLPGLDIPDLSFHVNNYEVLTSVYGEKIDGIIGYSFFKQFIVAINFDSLLIEVYRPGAYDYPRGGYTLRPLFTALPIQFISFKDRKRFQNNFYIDTGAGLCFLLSDQYAKDSAVLHKKRKPKLTQAEGMAGRLRMRLTVVKELRIGPYKFRKVPTYLYQDDYNVLSYPFTGGLIGNELLRRFNLVINYPQREIHMKPNGHFRDAFDYTYTGLGIYYIDNQIVVEDVIPGSPADKAGFRVGDEIFAIGTNFTRNIQQYKNLLLAPRQKIKVIIIRDGELMNLTIKTGVIY